MPIQQDFFAYHKSIGEELKNSQARIRNLIGSSHWATDGAHKESILRKVITEFAPEVYRVGTGFVCLPNRINGEGSNSGQIDILITSKNNPTLYKSGELVFVTPDCVDAIVEVKSKVSNGSNLRYVLKKLSDDIKCVRENSGNTDRAWAGLFIYNADALRDEHVLEMLQEITENNPLGVINSVSIGESVFLRFWETGNPTNNENTSPVWHSYNIQNLSHAYFVSNLVSHLSPNFNNEVAQAWFPIEGTKELYRSRYAKLIDRKSHLFY